MLFPCTLANGGLWSVHISSSSPVLPPHTFPLFWSGVLPWDTVILGIFSCSSMVSTGFREMLPLLQSFPGAAEKSLFWHLQLSSSLTWLFLMFFPLTPLCGVFCPFLSTFSPRHHHLCWEAQLCPVVCPMEVAGTICMQQAPLQPSHHSNLDTCTQ